MATDPATVVLGGLGVLAAGVALRYGWRAGSRPPPPADRPDWMKRGMKEPPDDAGGSGAAGGR